MFRMWMRLSGVSRGTSTSLRRSFSVTSAARLTRSLVRPVAIAASDRIEHGITTIPMVWNDPDEIAAPRSPCGSCDRPSPPLRRRPRRPRTSGSAWRPPTRRGASRSPGARAAPAGERGRVADRSTRSDRRRGALAGALANGAPGRALRSSGRLAGVAGRRGERSGRVGGDREPLAAEEDEGDVFDHRVAAVRRRLNRIASAFLRGWVGTRPHRRAR
jgi:hypothetical protein